IPMNSDDIYTPLEDAVAGLHARRRDAALCTKVEEFHRNHPPDFMEGGPYACLCRQIITADNEMIRFLDLSRDSNLAPLGLSITRDRFSSKNPDKLTYLKLPFRVRHQVRCLNIVGEINDGVILGDVVCRNGMSLVEFHRRMLEHEHPGWSAHVRDISEWGSDSTHAHLNYERYLEVVVLPGTPIPRGKGDHSWRVRRSITPRWMPRRA
ncbi:MAG: hypothetical protein WEB60_01540, partial [Terrimicrobiaceae bacterium]